MYKLATLRAVGAAMIACVSHPSFQVQISMPFRASELIEVKQIPRKGRGVFARRFIPAGTVFERVPVLVIPAEEVLESTDDPVLADYVFDWGKGTVALALGYGSMYNHSYSPNARYDDQGRQTKIFTALRDIQAGEEITINYNGHQDDQTPVGFDVVETPKRSGRKSRRAETTQDIQVRMGSTVPTWRINS